MRRVAAVLLAAAALAAVLLVTGGGGDEEPPAAPADGAARSATTGLAPPPKAAFEIGKPVPLAESRHETRWAPVRRAVAVRARPDAGAPEVTRLETRTPEGTENLVVALARTEAPGGQLWVRVSVASLPNGLRGWVPRAALGGYTTVTTHLTVDREALTATLTDDGREVFSAPVGVGMEDAPTPPGSFYVRNRLKEYESPFYGPLAFGTSARSETLTDWPDGGFVGIHGTSLPDLIPGRVSHGCIRLRNPDILRLAKLMPIGTPVTIA